jgi:hypothetical protein
MGLEQIKQMPAAAREGLRRGTFQVSVGLYLAWITPSLNLIASMMADEMRLGRDLPRLRIIAGALVNVGTGLAAVGTIVAFRSLARSWRPTLSAVTVIMSAATIFAATAWQCNGSLGAIPLIEMCIVPWCLHAWFAALFLHGLGPLVDWDMRGFFDSARKELGTAEGTLRQGVRSVRRPRLKTILRFLRALRVPLVCLAAFDASLFLGMYLIDRMIYPVCFGVMPPGQLLMIALGPILLIGLFLFVIAPMCIATTAVILLFVLLASPMGRLVTGTARLRRDLAWTPVDHVDLPALSL